MLISKKSLTYINKKGRHNDVPIFEVPDGVEPPYKVLQTSA